jgi:hypothetical protein
LRGRTTLERTVEAVWSWHPWAGAKLAGDHLQATVTKKVMDAEESAEDTVKTIAQGRPGSSGWTCGDLLVSSFLSDARLRVRLAPGFPCALISKKGKDFKA